MDHNNSKAGNIDRNDTNYYTSGQFAQMAQVTLRTIRYYDKQNILKPSCLRASGARLYTDQDFARLQQILLLKYLGFSLEDIKDMTINDSDYRFLLNSLNLQRRLVQDRMEQLQLVEKAIQDTTEELEQNGSLDWNKLLSLIHLTNMEKSLAGQYKNSTNISARINLHHLYSVNQQGWFPWIYEQCEIHPAMKLLELGCGNGALWTENYDRLPGELQVILSDISDGMLRDIRRTIGMEDTRFTFEAFDCSEIPYPDASFELVIANHVLFYCEDIPRVCSEIARVLKPGGRCICSTYGADHMREITELVQAFDNRIILSEDPLYEKFGKDNGKELLNPFFREVTWRRYEDRLLINSAEPLIEYIISCHGNQNQYILDRYKEFRAFVSKRIGTKFTITKDAGLFICEK